MYLILSDRHDVSAQWAYLGLRRKGLEPLMLVTGDMLAAARRLDHRIGLGPPTFEITLRDGRTILSGDVGAGLNRLAAVPPPPVVASEPADVDYATQELYALYLSMFAAIGPRLVNCPSPQGLSGPWLQRIEWLRLAHLAGLETLDFAESTAGGSAGGDFTASATGRTHRLVVVGDEVFGDAPRATASGSMRLAELVGCHILGLEFAIQGQSWRFASATTTPDLTAGGDRLLDRLAVVLSDLARTPQ